ncbi:prepilin-type N-terminal cleavage/methylation domain-containing protein [Candidatus Poribacteria bacterium]|nr:prepilin-type N-terminal cleavage/methylation domain-containing protein [Candidatus Poribacteria bacterium]
MKKLTQAGVTLIELIVVLVIISILSTVAVGIYTKEVLRAKVARTRAEIRTLEVSINRYQIDVGQYPPSSTGTTLASSALDPVSPFAGCGYMQVGLRASLNGVASDPLSPRWLGPYIEWDENRLGTLTGGPLTAGISRAQVQFLDPFGMPYYYIRNEEYDSQGGTFLPTDHPFFALETYFNPSTFQLISLGADGTTDLGGNAVGTETDDITNWEGPSI